MEPTKPTIHELALKIMAPRRDTMGEMPSVFMCKKKCCKRYKKSDPCKKCPLFR